jgi:hypothetical protein
VIQFGRECKMRRYLIVVLFTCTWTFCDRENNVFGILTLWLLVCHLFICALLVTEFLFQWIFFVFLVGICEHCKHEFWTSSSKLRVPYSNVGTQADHNECFSPCGSYEGMTRKSSLCTGPYTTFKTTICGFDKGVSHFEISLQCT